MQASDPAVLARLVGWRACWPRLRPWPWENLMEARWRGHCHRKTLWRQSANVNAGRNGGPIRRIRCMQSPDPAVLARLAGWRHGRPGLDVLMHYSGQKLRLLMVECGRMAVNTTFADGSGFTPVEDLLHFVEIVRRRPSRRVQYQARH